MCAHVQLCSSETCWVIVCMQFADCIPVEFGIDFYVVVGAAGHVLSIGVGICNVDVGLLF